MTGDAGHLRCWVAVSDDPAAAITGEYFHLQRGTLNPAAGHVGRQEQLLDACKRFSGEDLPTNQRKRRPNVMQCPEMS